MRKKKVYLVLSLDDEGYVNILKIFASQKRAEELRSTLEERDTASAKKIGYTPDIYYVREYELD